MPSLKTLALALAAFLTAQSPLAAQQQAPRIEQPVLQLQQAHPPVPRCSEITAMGSEYDALASACQYSLSPESLPNFICEETIKRSALGHKLDLVTTEVTVIRGRDRYSQYTRDGKPVQTIERTGGWVPNALFSSQLNAIFRPESKSTFALKPREKSHGAPATVYTFHFLTNPGRTYFNPGHSNAGFSGTVAIDSANKLQRVESIASDLYPDKKLDSYSSVLNYSDVPIPGLGSLRLPVTGEEKVCLTSGACYKNELAFHDCRKFGSEARIVPNADPDVESKASPRP